MLVESIDFFLCRMNPFLRLMLFFLSFIDLFENVFSFQIHVLAILILQEALPSDQQAPSLALFLCEMFGLRELAKLDCDSCVLSVAEAHFT